MVEKGVKAEFEALASRISRLEALRDELDALDTRGFESDVHLMRARLKDVSALPELERAMVELRRKIHARDSGKVKSQTNSESHVLKRKIKELEKLITQKRSLSGRKQLSHKDLDFVKDIPQLERELGELKKQFKSHVSRADVRVDAGVGVMVDAKFDDFIAQLKGELSKRVREKELELDSTLKHDLDLQHHAYAERYQQLVEEFHQKYREKVEHDLKKEIERRLEAEVDKRLTSERQKLLMDLGKENMKRLEHERARLTGRLTEAYAVKMKQFKTRTEQLAAKERSVRARTEATKREHAKLQAQFERSKAMLDRDMQKRRQELNERLKEARMHEHRAIESVSARKVSLNKRMAQLEQMRKEIRESKAKLNSLTSHEQEMVRRKLLALGLEQRHALKSKEAQLAVEQRRLESERARASQQMKQATIDRAKLAAVTASESATSHREREALRKKLDAATAAAVASGQKQREQNHKRLSLELKKLHEQQHKALARKSAEVSKELELLKKEERAKQQRTHKERVLLMKRFELIKAKSRMRVLQEEKRLQARAAAFRVGEQQEFAKLAQERKLLQQKFEKLEKLKRAEHERLVAGTRAQEAKLRADMERKLEANVKSRERGLRRRLEHEYALKMRAELQRRAAVFDKRRAELEQHIIEQAKRFFK